MRREARIRTWRSENFFSSSRVRLVAGGVSLNERFGERWEEVPLLDLVEAGEERDGDEDDDGFFAVADLELWVEGDWISFKGIARNQETGGWFLG